VAFFRRAEPREPADDLISLDIVLPRGEAKRFGMGPAVVLGQDLAEAAGPVGDGTAADLAARDRKLGNGHGEAAGT
jgi:hypothetical protein